MTIDLEVGNILGFVEYFGQKASGLHNEAMAQKIFDNPVDKGDNREKILMGFLDSHIPNRCEIIQGGYVFDAWGNRSQQIDLIITSEFTLQFKQKFGTQQTRSFNCSEGTISAISVKSTLDKKELVDSIDKLASLPTNKQVITRAGLDTDFTELIMRMPYKIIFAYKGIEPETLLKHLEYLKEKKLNPIFTPDLIVVNSSCFISKVPYTEKSVKPDAGLPYGSYILHNDSKHIGALALMRMVFEIQSMSNISSLMTMSFSKYEETAYRAINRNKELPKTINLHRNNVFANSGK